MHGVRSVLEVLESAPISRFGKGSVRGIHLPKDGVSVKIFEGQKLERVESVELASDLTGQKSVKSEVEGSRGSEVDGLER